MLSLGNDIKALTIRGTTSCYLDGRQVRRSVTGKLVDKETFSFGGLDVDIGESSCGGIISLLCLLVGDLIELIHESVDWTSKDRRRECG